MNFRTQIHFKKEKFQIDYNSKILLFGSCFSENIGNKLSHFKFQSALNPFGILFHTKAIENLIANAINKKEYNRENIFYHNERWHCFDVHSFLSNPSKDKLLSALNNSINLTNHRLLNSTHLIITLGTAWVYRYIESDTIVANCHKIPQKKFLKELLTINEVSESIASIISLVRSINKKVEIIFTVSPIRHLKDGFEENSLSKAHLISAVHQIIEPRNHTHYFPSYEIMTDDLRDYRFYKKDMIHPNDTAIDYIWEIFKDSWISEDTSKSMLLIDKIQKGLKHDPFNKNSEQHEHFLLELNKKIELISQKLPHITFD